MVAACAEPGSPFNKVAGLGFAGLPSAADLDEIEEAFAAHAADAQIELSALAEPDLGALLTDRGYRLTSFENVVGRALAGQIEPMTPPEVDHAGSSPWSPAGLRPSSVRALRAASS